MTRHELELAYPRAMQEWMNEENNTRRMVMQQNASGFSEQVKKEKVAYKKYREAQQAFVNGPKQ